MVEWSSLQNAGQISIICLVLQLKYVYSFKYKICLVLQLNFNSTYSSQRHPKTDSYQSIQKASISNNNNIHDALYL